MHDQDQTRLIRQGLWIYVIIGSASIATDLLAGRRDALLVGAWRALGILAALIGAEVLRAWPTARLARRVSGFGRSVGAAVTGSRPLVLEVQALTPKTGFSIPKKLGVGYDMNRLFVMTAVIEKVLGLPFFDRDVYVNVTGGIKVNEPGVDLSVVASMISSYRNVAWKDAAFFGEVGLTGEVRRVVNMEGRLRECARLGIKRVFGPRGIEDSAGCEVIPVRTIKELYEHLK